MGYGERSEIVDERKKHLITAIYAAIEAGGAILEVYGTDFKVDHKKDDSPLTLADRNAHGIIASRLKPSNIPVLSEEGKEIPFTERKHWESLWIVDPLDGTKEFISRNGEFTVNIALVERGRPVMGVIYVPTRDTLYFAHQGLGAHKTTDSSKILNPDKPVGDLQKIFNHSNKLPLQLPSGEVFTIIGSRSHPSAELETFVREMREKHTHVEFISAGSSLKFCRVAEGKAHVYPRFGLTMEWDTAAGQAIAENSGISVLNAETGLPLHYNKENLLNPWFIVRGRV
jgi:3'(2'), 5'-bisphosphate nucleotidase